MSSNSKIIIYQVITRLFGNIKSKGKFNGTIEDNGVGKFNDFTNLVLKKIKDMGITHIWYTGVIEHATGTDYSAYGIPIDYPEIVKGRAGSPYAIKDYFDVQSCLSENIPNRMNEFVELVNRTHQKSLKVLIDFVPNHLARNYKSDSTPEGFEDFGINDNISVEFSPTNDFYYLPGQPLRLPEKAIEDARNLHNGQKQGTYQENPAKVTGNDVFSASPSYTDWFETVKLNYGIDFKNNGRKNFNPIPPIWHKMLHVLRFWALKGVDGFRVDMAEMVPAEFWSWVISRIKSEFKDIVFIAEIYKPHEYHNYINSGFDFLYDKKGFYENVRKVLEGNASTHTITSVWQNNEGLNDFMLRFLENHDEERIGSDKFHCEPLNAIPGVLLAATMNKGPFLLYFGQELGEPAKGASGFSGDDGKTSIFDYFHVPEHQKWMNFRKFDGEFLSDHQKQLRELYIRIMNLAVKEDAIINGSFYDLMWANKDKDFYKAGKIYGFLRYSDKQVLLIVLNFDHHNELTINLRIPEHALQLMQIDKDKIITFSEIYSEYPKKEIACKILMTEGVKLTLSASSGLVYKIL